MADIQKYAQFLRGFLGEQERKQKETKLNKLMAGQDNEVKKTVNPVTGESQYTISPVKKVDMAKQLKQQLILKWRRDPDSLSREEKIFIGIAPRTQVNVGLGAEGILSTYDEQTQQPTAELSVGGRGGYRVGQIITIRGKKYKVLTDEADPQLQLVE